MMLSNNSKFNIRGGVKPADVLLIVPPFASFTDPNLATGILKASVQNIGYSCSVLYANLILAAAIGFETYDRIAGSDIEYQIGEQLFAKAAHDINTINLFPDSQELWHPDVITFQKPNENRSTVVHSELLELSKICEEFVNYVVDIIENFSPKIVGFSSTLQQTNSSIAIARTLKQKFPNIITVIGGNNCLGEMGEELAQSATVFDFVFQGEADFSFAEFCLKYLQENILPEKKLIQTGSQQNLDLVPIPDYDDYQDQAIIPLEQSWIYFESSRGCWWGEKHHCTFCGLMGTELAYRAKSPERLIDELFALRDKYPEVQRYFAADLIAPIEYFKSTFRLLGDLGFNRELYYEIKANINATQLLVMKRAGVVSVQPGIESLSARSLVRMRKGTTPLINIRLLRNCREIDIVAVWNILSEIPGDTAEEYEEQIPLIPLLEHLHPPSTVGPIVIQRFSPYHFDSKGFDISGVEPSNGYKRAFPPNYNIKKLAYCFDGNFTSEGKERPDLIGLLREAVNKWLQRWHSGSSPELSVKKFTSENWIIIDTRECRIDPFTIIGRAEYELIRSCRQGIARHKITNIEILEQFLSRGFIVDINNQLISLVCDSNEFSNESQQRERNLPVIS